MHPITAARIDEMIMQHYGHLIAQYDNEPKRAKKRDMKDYMRVYMGKRRALIKREAAEK
jgi:hypothetical protein